MIIGIASDHRGYELKQVLTNKLKQLGYNIKDYGTNSTKRVDYPNYAFRLGEAYNNREIDYAVAICGSAIGISIALNKVKNMLCAKVDSIEDVIHAKERDYVNSIAISGNTDINTAISYVETLVNTDYNEDFVYLKRKDIILKYEEGLYHEY